MGMKSEGIPRSTHKHDWVNTCGDGETHMIYRMHLPSMPEYKNLVLQIHVSLLHLVPIRRDRYFTTL